MKKLTILLTIAIIAATACQASAADRRLGVTFDTTFASKYMWHGFNIYGHDNSAIQPSVDLDFWQTGFGAMVWYSRANRSGFENAAEFDYILYYGASIFEDSPIATDYRVSWLYYDYYDNKSRDTDLQELVFSFTWPNILPYDIVPTYSTGLLWPSRSSVPGLKNVGGWVHTFGLAYDLQVPDLGSAPGGQTFSFIADLTYNDGYNGANVDHDWSHSTLGVSTAISICENLTFTPGLYYQISMEDTVNTNDELWTTLGLSYEF